MSLFSRSLAICLLTYNNDFLMKASLRESKGGREGRREGGFKVYRD